jgi:hypothetical protein
MGFYGLLQLWRYSDHQDRAQTRVLCQSLRVIIQRNRLEARRCAFTPGDRGLWVKTKSSHHQEFIVIGWTDPEGAGPWLGSLLLGYCLPNSNI